jgi:hypothetical protein
MALIECGECSRQVSDKAPACPGCGAPVASAKVSSAVATARPVAALPKKKGTLLPLLLALLCGAGYLAYRANSGPAGSISPAGSPPVFRQPEKVVSERVSLKEGEARMYSFTLQSAAKVGVKINANPKNVDVMLMTAADLNSYKNAHGKLFGGRYSYRKALSRQGILEMTESEVLPPGEWAIVVQRPDEDALFKHDTSASVDVTVY